jgi:hypothetical protein
MVTLGIFHSAWPVGSGSGQGVGVDERAARHADDIDALLHQRELLLAQHLLGCRRPRRAYRDHVGLWQQRVELVGFAQVVDRG